MLKSISLLINLSNKA